MVEQVTSRTTYEQRKRLRDEQRRHVPDYQPRTTPDAAIYQLNAGTRTAIFVSMPVAGTCSGSVIAASDQTDLDRISREIIARVTAIRTDNAPTVDLIVTDLVNYELFKQGRNYVAYHRTGPVRYTQFALDLPAGLYAFILNNPAALTAKTVKLTFGPEKAK